MRVVAHWARDVRNHTLPFDPSHHAWKRATPGCEMQSSANREVTDCRERERGGLEGELDADSGIAKICSRGERDWVSGTDRIDPGVHDGIIKVSRVDEEDEEGHDEAHDHAGVDEWVHPAREKHFVLRPSLDTPHPCGPSKQGVVDCFAQPAPEIDNLTLVSLLAQQPQYPTLLVSI